MLKKRKFIEQNAVLHLVEIDNDTILCLLIKNKKIIHNRRYSTFIPLGWESKMVNTCFNILKNFNNK